MTSPKLVVFDFDYTLADSSKGIVASVQHAFSRRGLAVPDEAAIKATIGLSLDETFRRLCPDASSDGRLALTALFQERASEVMVQETVMLPHVDAVTARLRARGIRLAIVSTKFAFRIAEILERAGLRHRFEAVVGGEQVSQHKPHPEGLERVLRLAEVSPSEALLVGDSIVDAETAVRAGVSFVAVLTGTTSAEDFARYPCRAVLADLSGLPEYCGPDTQ